MIAGSKLRTDLMADGGVAVSVTVIFISLFCFAAGVCNAMCMQAPSCVQT
jgi:hypothetical protein